MMQWWRCKHGAPFDTKWRTIARRVNGRPGDVWAVASSLFDAASQAEPRGDISKVDLEEIADGFGYDLDYVTRIYEELKNKDVHDGQLVLNFEKHQTYEDTTAAERKRRQREREKAEKEARERHAESQEVTNSHDEVTLGHGDVTVERDETVTVTTDHAPSQHVTPPDTDSDQKRPEQIRPEESSLRSLSAREVGILDVTEVAHVAPAGAVVELPDFLRRFPDDLKQFLLAFPNTGQGPDETAKAWKATEKVRPPLDLVLVSVANYVAQIARENLARPPDNQRQPCHASKWLKEKRWERYALLPERPKIEGDEEAMARARRAAWGGHPAVEMICTQVGEQTYDRYFAPCRLTFVDDKPKLTAPSRLVRDELELRHWKRLEDAFGQPVEIELEKAPAKMVAA